MLIEKAKYRNTLAINLEKIVQELNSKDKVYTEEQKKLLIIIISLTLRRKLEEEEANKLIKNLKEGGKEMLAVLEMIDEENKRIFRNGKREGEKRGEKRAKLKTAKKLLAAKVPVEIIVEATELTEKEIKKLSNL